MGNCTSCEPKSNLTAKLIRLDGELEEFTYPIKVSILLDDDSKTFICDSDDLDFGEFVTAVKADEELQPGQLYFELPSNWLNHRLQAEEMASLAVKASVALAGDDDVAKCCSCCGCKKGDDPILVFGEKESGTTPLMASAHGGGGGGVVVERRGMGGVGGCRRQKFTAKLSVIVEE